MEMTTMNQAEIEAVWAEFSVQPTGADMTNECRLAAGIIALRAEVSRKAGCRKCQAQSLLDGSESRGKT